MSSATSRRSATRRRDSQKDQLFCRLTLCVCFRALRSRLSSHCFFLSSFMRSPQVRMHATLMSRLNSCTGFKKAPLSFGSKICDVFSVCKENPSGTAMVSVELADGTDIFDDGTRVRVGQARRRPTGRRNCPNNALTSLADNFAAERHRARVVSRTGRGLERLEVAGYEARRRSPDPDSRCNPFEEVGASRIDRTQLCS